MTTPSERPGISPFGKKDSYSKAEVLLQEKKYEQALKRFLEFIDQYPQDDRVDSAMFNIGTIYSHTGAHDRAMEYFMALVNRYPRSPMVMDAHIEMVRNYAALGQFEKAIESGLSLKSQSLSESQMMRVHLFLADAYMGWGFPAKALPLYVQVLENTEGEEADRIFQRMEESIRQLSDHEAEELLEMRGQDSISGTILFKLALIQASQEAYDSALKNFTRFVELYPTHEKVTEAHQWLDILYKKFTFEPNTIGCLLPLSGPYETYGKRALKGIELALARSSDEQGLPLRIVVRDTASDPEQAAAAVKELADEGVSAIVGPFVTAEAAAAAAQQRGVPIICMTQKDKIADIGDFVFRNFITPRMQVRTMADYVMDELQLRRFAILYPDEPYGSTFMTLFWEEVRQRGGEVVGVESYDPEQTDFADPIKKIVGTHYELPKEMRESPAFLRAHRLSGKPAQSSILGLDTIFSAPVRDTMGIVTSDTATLLAGRSRRSSSDDEPPPIIDFDAIFIPDSPKKAGLIIPQLAYYDVNDVYLLGTNLWHSESLIKMSRQYAQGALMVDGFFAKSESPEVRSFVEEYSAVYDKEPGIIEAIAYDNAMILLEQASRTDIQLRTELRDILLDMAVYRGVTGATVFSENGEADKQLYLLRIKGADFIEVGTGRPFHQQ